MITGTVPPPEVPRRITEGVKVEGGRPYMNDVDPSSQWIYVEPERRYWYNTETEEIREKPDE